jgi:hypothetical protein
MVRAMELAAKVPLDWDDGSCGSGARQPTGGPDGERPWRQRQQSWPARPRVVTRT